MIKPLSLFSLLLIPAFALAGCVSVSPTILSATATVVPPTTRTPVISDTETSTPTEMFSLPSDTPSPTITLTPLDTLEPAQIKEMMQPLIKEPMNCAVPCFWGIVPGKTYLDEVRIFFNHLGFAPFEGEGFYTIEYKPDGGGGFSTTFYAPGTIVENIEVTPHITKQTKERNPREWIAYSPETLIKRYGKPSRVEFALDWGPNFVITMIMYFDTSDLIVLYSGYNMIPDRPRSSLLCPLTAPFDLVHLWMGQNPLDTPSFETVPLEKATSLTIDQFAQLMMGNPKKACFTLKGNSFQ
jgi:hypothetical protein